MANKSVRIVSVEEEAALSGVAVASNARGVASCDSFDSLPSSDIPNGTDENDNNNNNMEDEVTFGPVNDDGRQTFKDRRRRTISDEFNRFMSRRETLNPTTFRRSQLPTYFRPVYTGIWYKDVRTHCYPHGWNKYCWPLLLSFLAEVFTIWGCFSCHYFRGASIQFTGGRYGLWTLEDVHGKCQLWSVLFYAIDLGGPLRWARVFSMSGMVLGLAVLTTMAQAMQCHAISWGVGLILFLVFLVSISTTSTFNVWIVWALFNYVIFVLLVRACFVHPVARRISQRGTVYIAFCQLLCHVVTILTLVVLKSDFCTCDSLSPGDLDGRVTVELDPCEGVCALHVSGYMVIFASTLWLLSSLSTLRLGVQPDRLYIARPPEQFANYSRESITTRMKKKFASPSKIKSDSKSSDFSSNLPSADDPNDDHLDTRPDSDSNERTVGEDASPSRSVGGDDGNDGEEEEGKEEEKDEWPRVPKRTRCQKCCCDYRIVPRTRREKLLFWSFRCTLGFIVGLYTFLVMIMIGSRAENLNAQEAPSTSPYFITDLVCAFNPLDTSEPFQTFSSKQDTETVGWKVAHCGACGFCSNMPDIETYVETRKTIAKSAKQCGPVNFLGSFDDLVDCLQGKIDFSNDCTICWAENMRNTGRDCLFTCIHTLFTGFMASNNVAGAGTNGWLNHCLYCDEKLSGPAFATCSGVARRRLGIVSEIERNPAEQCRKVDVNWVNADFDKLRRKR